MDDAEIVRTAGSAYLYTTQGKNWCAAQAVSVTHREIDALATKDPDALGLLLYLGRHNWSRDRFQFATKAVAQTFGWRVPRLRAVRDRLVSYGLIACVTSAVAALAIRLYFDFSCKVVSDDDTDYPSREGVQPRASALLILAPTCCRSLFFGGQGIG